MRPFLAALLLLTVAVVLPAPATAQQSAALSISLTAPTGILTQDEPLVLQGVATFTADVTAMLGMTGTPVAYTVHQQPAWANVVISPATDVFPAPMFPSGIAYTVSRPFTVVITLAHDPLEDVSGLVAIAGTTAAAMFGQSAEGVGMVPVAYRAPEEPCESHAITEEQLAVWAAQATDVYNEYQASQEPEADEMSVQNTNASPIPLSWAAAGGFAVVGGAVGLLLRRRFAS